MTPSGNNMATKSHIDSNNVFLTVVMSVLDEELFIGETLQQLIEQEYPEHLFEILVVDGMSTDRTREIISSFSEKHSQVRLIDNPGRLAGSGRNIGFIEGVGDLFVIVDGHCYIPTRNFFKDTVECLLHSGADCLCRPQPLDPPNITGFQKVVACARQSIIGHGFNSLIYSDHEGFVSPVSNGAVYTRKVIEKVGLVDESFDACEDVEFNYRVEKMGFTSYMSPKLTVKYYPRGSISSLFKQMKRYGEGRFKFMIKHPESASLSTCIPFIFISFMIISLFSILLFPATEFFLTTMLLLYLIMLGVQSWAISRDLGIKYFLVLPLIFMTIHTALGWGFGSEFISRIGRFFQSRYFSKASM